MASAPQRTTKQSQTRDQVFDLMEQVGVGNAIPSERQLSQDLGVSRLTVRAAIDELAREDTSSAGAAAARSSASPRSRRS